MSFGEEEENVTGSQPPQPPPGPGGTPPINPTPEKPPES